MGNVVFVSKSHNKALFLTLFLSLAACSGGGGGGGGGGNGGGEVSVPSYGEWEFDPVDLWGAPSCLANTLDSSIELVHPKCKKDGFFVSNSQCDASTKPEPRPKTSAGTLQWTHNVVTPPGISSIVGEINLLNGFASLTCPAHYDARFDASFTGESIVFDCGSIGSADDHHYIQSLTRYGHVFYCASKVESVSAGSYHICAITSAGQVYCFYGSSKVLINEPGVTYKAISSGANHTCGITTTGQVKCWGNNGSGQLGTGNRYDSIIPLPINIGTSYKAISAGAQHTCGIVDDDNIGTPLIKEDEGIIKCWGWNGNGQLGIGAISTEIKSYPTKIEYDFSYKFIAAGENHTCAINNYGGALCWGNNYYGQLGHYPLFDSGSPVWVDDNATYKAISVGKFHTCGIIDDGDPSTPSIKEDSGKVKCWGDNQYGQLGYGYSPSFSYTPTTISDNATYKSISAGFYHTCGIVDDGNPSTPLLKENEGKVKCWGYNNYSQLGAPVLLHSGTPVEANLDFDFTYKSISSIDDLNCAVTNDDTVMCWGFSPAGIIAPF